MLLRDPKYASYIWSQMACGGTLCRGDGRRFARRARARQPSTPVARLRPRMTGSRCVERLTPITNRSYNPLICINTNDADFVDPFGCACYICINLIDADIS